MEGALLEHYPMLQVIGGMAEHLNNDSLNGLCPVSWRPTCHIYIGFTNT